jgi:2'-5' RNA ligase
MFVQSSASRPPGLPPTLPSAEALGYSHSVRSADEKTLLRQGQEKDTIESWRLFIAIELPTNTRHKIQQHIDRLRRELPDARASWTREENLHFTLKFFGNVSVGKVEDLSNAIQRATTRISPFEMVIVGCGAFPPKGNPRVLWIGVSPATQTPCQNLFEALEDECAKAGMPREHRPFHPHLTLARLRQPADSRHLATLHQQTNFNPITAEVRDVCLIRSELSSAGSRYTVVARHKLMS